MSPALNDEGIAYGYLTFVLMIVVGTVVYIILTPICNGFIDWINLGIAAGRVSVQTATAAQMLLSVFHIGTPVMLILMSFYYAIVRALEVKRVRV